MKSLGIATLLLICAHLPAMAQAYKCTVDGKSVYQGTPCATNGDKVNLSGAGQADASSAGTSYWQKEAAMQDRRQKLEEAVANRRVFIGMTSEEVLQSWGRPKKINQTVTGGLVSEQWVYEYTNINATQYVYLKNGVVTAMQSPR